VVATGVVAPNSIINYVWALRGVIQHC
jgi:hypothetical protein